MGQENKIQSRQISPPKKKDGNIRPRQAAPTTTMIAGHTSPSAPVLPHVISTSMSGEDNKHENGIVVTYGVRGDDRGPGRRTTMAQLMATNDKNGGYDGDAVCAWCVELIFTWNTGDEDGGGGVEAFDSNMMRQRWTRERLLGE
jgi:hypothetical protein